MVTTGSGDPYKIFTPFYRALRERMPPGDLLVVPPLSSPESWPKSDRLEDWNLLPARPDWAGGSARHGRWARRRRTPGWPISPGRADDYEERATCLRSMALLGCRRTCTSARFRRGQVWHAFIGQGGEGVESFLRQLVWRDYAANVLLQLPDYPERPYSGKFASLRMARPRR